MKLNWKVSKDNTPKSHSGFNSPYVPCIVYSCHTFVKEGGTIQTCRWDVKNKGWLKSDITSNWFLQQPYEITHFIDDANKPYEELNHAI